jgi:L-fucose dehydrogenase
VILVTDVAKGIGAAIVRACAAESAKVVIVDRDAEHGEKLQAEFSSAGNCSFVLADLGAEESCSQAVEQAVGNFGKLDALVNNAGVTTKLALGTATPTITLDRFSAIWCTTRVWPIMHCRI